MGGGAMGQSWQAWQEFLIRYDAMHAMAVRVGPR